MSIILSARLRKSFADVTRRKVRTLFVVLSIFLGVFAFTCINFTETTLFSAYSYSLGLNTTWPDIDMQINRIDATLMSELSATPNVQALQFHSIFLTQWYGSSVSGQIPLNIIGVPDLQHVPLTPFQLISGHYPGAGEIVMESNDQRLQSFSIGDAITVATAQGTAHLKVVGLSQSAGGSLSDNSRAYMSEAGIEQLAGPSALTSTLQVKVSQTNQEQQTAAALKTILQAHHVAVLNELFPRVPTVPLSQINGIATVLRIIAYLIVVLGGCVILNSVSTLITEQTGIIGVMKAIGGTRGAIMSGYLISVGIYSILGTLSGLILGLIGGEFLASRIAPTVQLGLGPFTVTPTSIIPGLLVGLGIPLLATFWPLWNGTRISVRDAFSAYGVSTGKEQSFLAGFGQRLIWISQVVWLGMRGTFRKRWRATLTLFMLILVTTSFLAVQIATNSISTTVAQANAQLDADINVQIGEKVPFSQVGPQISALPNVGRVEPYLSQQVATSWGSMQILGVEPDTHLYHYQLTGGRWLHPGETGAILLSDDALARTGLHIGSTLALLNQNKQKVPFTIIGTVRQSPYNLGQIGAAVMNITDLIGFEGLPQGSTPDMILQCRDRSAQAINQLMQQIGSLVRDVNVAYRGVQGSGVQIETLANQNQENQQSWYFLYSIFYAGVLILGLAGVSSLATTLSASVLERRREIGILRAIGAYGRQIGLVFWVEGLTLGGIAWVLGVLLGIPLAFAFIQIVRQLVLPVDFAVDPLAFIITLALILVVATVASLLPSWSASRIRIARILHYE